MIKYQQTLISKARDMLNSVFLWADEKNMPFEVFAQLIETRRLMNHFLDAPATSTDQTRSESATLEIALILGGNSLDERKAFAEKVLHLVMALGEGDRLVEKDGQGPQIKGGLIHFHSRGGFGK